jgi:hypothetical protein
MTTLQTGAPHFKALKKQFRQSNYTLNKSTNEFVDNAIKKATEIKLSVSLDTETGRLSELCVSDNYEHGFPNLDKTGAENPFNMGHVSNVHDNDSETSEFGVGMKAGALSTANHMGVYTRTTNPDGTHTFYEVICDFNRMEKEPDVNASYNPFIREITENEYNRVHPFKCGSTIKLTVIREAIYPKTTMCDIVADICNNLSNTYSRFILNGVNITVNGVKVEPIHDFFEDDKCKPFVITKKMYVFEHKVSGARRFLLKNEELYSEYSTKEGKWQRIPKSEVESVLKDAKDNYKSDVFAPINSEEGHCLTIRTAFTFFSRKLHDEQGGRTNFPLPEDTMNIYKDMRNYGKNSLFKHNDGTHNFTLNEIDFVSKRLGKDIGITFNKEIRMDGKNDIIGAIKSALLDSRRNISANRTTSAFNKLYEKACSSGVIDQSNCPESLKPIPPKNSAAPQQIQSVPDDINHVTRPENLINEFFAANTLPTKESTVVSSELCINNSITSLSFSDCPNTIVEEPAKEAIVEEPAKEAVVEEPAKEAIAEEAIKESIAEEPVKETIVEEALFLQNNVGVSPALRIHRPIPTLLTSLHPLSGIAQQPIVEEPAKEVIVEEPAKEVIVEEPAKEVIVEEPAKEVIVEEPAKEVIVEENQSIVEEPTKEVIVEENQSIVEELTKEVIVEEPAKEVIVEELTKEVIVEEVQSIVEELTKEVIVEEPAKENQSIVEEEVIVEPNVEQKMNIIDNEDMEQRICRTTRIIQFLQQTLETNNIMDKDCLSIIENALSI